MKRISSNFLDGMGKRGTDERWMLKNWFSEH
jgi:hypothetical protein